MWSSDRATPAWLATHTSPKDSSAAAGSAGESDHAELALVGVISSRRHEPAVDVPMIGFTRKEASGRRVNFIFGVSCAARGRPGRVGASRP